MSKYFSRVSLTSRAAHLIDKLRAEHGDIIFHQSGGCCDGSVPMCIPKEEFHLGASDMYIGNVYDCGFYMHSDNFSYFKNTHITLDVDEGRGSGFSLENGSGERFITHQRLFKPEEEESLFPVEVD